MVDPPLLAGANHEIEIVVEVELTVKAVGESGTVGEEVLIANAEVKELLPMLLIEATLKLYVEPAVNPVLVKKVSI